MLCLIDVHEGRKDKLTSARGGPVSEGPVSEGPVSGGTKQTMGEGLVFARRGSAEGEGTTDRTEGGGLVFARQGVGLSVAQRSDVGKAGVRRDNQADGGRRTVGRAKNSDVGRRVSVRSSRVGRDNHWWGGRRCCRA